MTRYRHRIALLFKRNHPVASEYYLALTTAGYTPDLSIAVGVFAPEWIEHEIERTGGLWHPAPPPPITHTFESLSDPALPELLRANAIDIAVQGGLGLVGPDLLAAPRIGFLNVHPGRLPRYRGSSCPEWALWERQPIVLTAHLMDAGLDTGPVLIERPYAIGETWTYHRIRAGIYPRAAEVLVEAIALLCGEPADRAAALARPQANDGARTLKAMPQDILTRLKTRLEARPPIKGIAP